jgi:hypothetical protein
MNDKHDDTLDFSIAIVTWAMARGEEHDLDGHDVIRAIAQSLALAIEMTVQTGRKKKMAADMAKIVGSFPSIKHDNQKPLN